MGKEQFTPGPWRIAEDRPMTSAGLAIYGPDEKWNALGSLAIVKPCPTPDYAPGESAGEANARLIAAAPELLEALRGLADCAGITCLPGYRLEMDSAMRTARAAISKATRESE